MCHFQDLEAIYDTISSELICMLCKEMRYFYGRPAVGDVNLPAPNSFIPQVPLLKKCDPNFRFAANTLGHQFELFYNDVKSQPYIPLNSFFAGYAYGGILSTNGFNLGEVRVFLALLYYMEKLSEVITTSIGSFNLSVFNTRFDDLNRVALLVKALINRGDEGNTESVEDMSDHLDVIIYGCRQAQFAALYNDYKLRWLYLAMLQKFGYYIKLNPGIQHKAGVPMGGTFIMVYHEATRTPANNNLNTAFNNAATGANTRDTAAAAPRMMKAKAAETDKMNMVAGDAEKEGSVNFNAEADAVKTHQSAGKIKNVFTDRQQNMLNALLNATTESVDEALAETIRRIPNGTVIADFYLPYLCCSDCPPVYYVVANEPDPLSISLKQKDYCSDDKGPYDITVSPSGGSVSGEGVTTNANGGFQFTPSAVSVPDGSKSKTVTITYTKDGQSASTTVTVYRKPTAMFAIEAASVYTTLHFQNQSADFDKVSWNFGDNTPVVTEDSPFHNFSEEGTYTVTLTATNGVCSDTHTATIEIMQVSIQINPKEFCINDQKCYPVSGTPVGGNVAGEGVATDDFGKYCFRPSDVSLSEGETQKNITLTYTAPNGQVAATDVTVYGAAYAVIDTVYAADGPFLHRFIGYVHEGEEFIWDLGDGNTSTELDFFHTYQQSGTYTVTLTAKNGPCSATDTRVITVGGNPLQKVCQPLESIIGDFNGLEQINKDIFQSFVKQYKPYGEVASFFKRLTDVAGKTIADQVDFFAASKFSSLMVDWLTALNPFVTGGNMRIIALALYKVFERLAMYVACIQEEDITKAKVPMGEVFKLMQKQMSGWSTLVGSLPAAEKTIVKQIGELFAEEAKQLDANGEAGNKPDYLSILKKLADLVSSFKL
jgi:PKD repeat protein